MFSTDSNGVTEGESEPTNPETMLASMAMAVIRFITILDFLDTIAEPEPVTVYDQINDNDVRQN